MSLLSAMLVIINKKFKQKFVVDKHVIGLALNWNLYLQRLHFVCWNANDCHWIKPCLLFAMSLA